jgi:hypothetical protein
MILELTGEREKEQDPNLGMAQESMVQASPTFRQRILFNVVCQRFRHYIR